MCYYYLHCIICIIMCSEFSFMFTGVKPSYDDDLHNQLLSNESDTNCTNSK